MANRFHNMFDLTGNVGADPTLTMDGDRAIAKVRIAVDDNYKDKKTGELVERTDWFTITVFGPRAEWLAKWIKKGGRIRAAGKIKPGSFEHKTAKDAEGKPLVIYTTEFHALDIDPLRWGGEQQGAAAPAAPAMPVGDDDIPF